MAAAIFAHAPAGTVLFATHAPSHFATYNALWQANYFLREDTSPLYPMPRSSEVVDLLPALAGANGLAIHTQPETTVTEGMGYGMFVAGMNRDVATLKGLVAGWQANGQAFGGQPACGGCCPSADNDPHDLPRAVCASAAAASGSLCRRVLGAYMPGWRMPMADSGSMGSATDADEDAVTGIIYLAELLDDDDVRQYALRSIAAFVLEDLGLADPIHNSRAVPNEGDIPRHLRTIWLWRGGSCWGGYDAPPGEASSTNRKLCLAPAYFSPGQWRLFARYLERHADLMPIELLYTVEQLVDVLESAITWGYNILNRISCPNGLVSNWWTLPLGTTEWPWANRNGLRCHNSGTNAGEYGADAVRIPWRVALDYIWFPSAASPLFDEGGKRIGTWGAKEYSLRWSKGWIEKIQSRGFPVGSYPPYKTGVTRLRPDQILPLLTTLQACTACPHGMTASPWNGWGSYPIATAFMIPADDLSPQLQQEWLDFISDAAFEGCSRDKYFDVGSSLLMVLFGLALWMLIGSALVKRRRRETATAGGGSFSLGGGDGGGMLSSLSGTFTGSRSYLQLAAYFRSAGGDDHGDVAAQAEHLMTAAPAPDEPNVEAGSTPAVAASRVSALSKEEEEEDDDEEGLNTRQQASSGPLAARMPQRHHDLD